MQADEKTYPDKTGAAGLADLSCAAPRLLLAVDLASPAGSTVRFAAGFLGATSLIRPFCIMFSYCYL